MSFSTFPAPLLAVSGRCRLHSSLPCWSPRSPFGWIHLRTRSSQPSVLSNPVYLHCPRLHRLAHHSLRSRPYDGPFAPLQQSLSVSSCSSHRRPAIVFSLLLLHFGYRYTLLQAFASGASLCSTSLGTTLSLLAPPLRRTRVGTVLMSAALLDDIAGLVIAAIISQLSSNTAGPISSKIVVRPILVSFAFGLGTLLMAWSLRIFACKTPLHRILARKLYTTSMQLCIIITTFSGFIAGSNYAGTSELFGAYLAGAFLAYVLRPQHWPDSDTAPPSIPNQKPPSVSPESEPQSPLSTFSTFLSPILTTFFSPIFFASIGTALPVRALGAPRAAWRGIVYALLMGAAKAAAGAWMLLRPNRGLICRRKSEISTSTQVSPESEVNSTQPTPSPSLLLGVAMVARGEIALIVVQLARPLLVGDNSQEEPFAVAVWAILLTTVGGAVGVGCVLRRKR